MTVDEVREIMSPFEETQKFVAGDLYLCVECVEEGTSSFFGIHRPKVVESPTRWLGKTYWYRPSRQEDWRYAHLGLNGRLHTWNLTQLGKEHKIPEPILLWCLEHLGEIE